MDDKPATIRRNHKLIAFCEPDQIDKHTLEIAQADDEVYNNMQELADELPDHSPRYVLLSYPLTLVRSAVNPARRLLAYAVDSHLVVCLCPMYYCTTSQSLAMRSYGCSMPARRN